MNAIILLRKEEITMLTAHSGSDNTAPNSWEFIHKYINTKVDAIEVDIRMNENEELYLFHDKLDVMTSETVYLEDVVKLLKKYPQMYINCDLKEENLEQPVIQLFKRNGIIKQLILSGTVDLDHVTNNPIVCFNIENYYPDFYSNSQLRDSQWIKGIHEYLNQYDVNILNVNYRFFDKKTCEDVLEEGLQLSMWTVDDENARALYHQLQVFNITTRQITESLKEYLCSNI